MDPKESTSWYLGANEWVANETEVKSYWVGALDLNQSIKVLRGLGYESHSCT